MNVLEFGLAVISACVVVLVLVVLVVVVVFADIGDVAISCEGGRQIKSVVSFIHRISKSLFVCCFKFDRVYVCLCVNVYSVTIWFRLSLLLGWVQAT